MALSSSVCSSLYNIHDSLSTSALNTYHRSVVSIASGSFVQQQGVRYQYAPPNMHLSRLCSNVNEWLEVHYGYMCGTSCHRFCLGRGGSMSNFFNEILTSTVMIAFGQLATDCVDSIKFLSKPDINVTHNLVLRRLWLKLLTRSSLCMYSDCLLCWSNFVSCLKNTYGSSKICRYCNCERNF